MRCPWYLVVPMNLVRLAGQTRYAASRGWLVWEPRVWAEFLWRIPLSLLNRRAVSTKAVKICVAVNRIKISDAKSVWELGKLSWWRILRGKLPGHLREEATKVS
jgi:hypothetical protein